MIRLPQDFLDFIKLLNDHCVEYVIVGGYAVAIYGYVRYTGDIDFFIAISAKNAERMVKVFNLFGLSQPDINAALFMDSGKILRIGAEPMRLEVFNQISGVDFDACYKNRKIIDVEGVPVNFVGYSELLKNKSSTGREKDVADVAELRKRNPLEGVESGEFLNTPTSFEPGHQDTKGERVTWRGKCLLEWVCALSFS